jgi:hypothetical protein
LLQRREEAVIDNMVEEEDEVVEDLPLQGIL